MIIIYGNLINQRFHRKVIYTQYGKASRIKSPMQKSSKNAPMMDQLKANLKEWRRMIEGKTYPLRVGFVFHRLHLRAFEYNTLGAGMIDAMVAAGYIGDSTADFIIPVYRYHTLDRKNPRTEISVI